MADAISTKEVSAADAFAAEGTPWAAEQATIAADAADYTDSVAPNETPSP